MATKIVTELLILSFLGLLCFISISLSADSNNEQCYSTEENRICYLQGSMIKHSWNDSRHKCNSIKFTLPYFLNIKEQNTLEEYLKYLHERLGQVKLYDVWTSGIRKVYDNWTWINGQPSLYFLPVESRIGGTHVILTGTQSLLAENPSNSTPYLCQYPKDHCESIVSNKIDLRKSCVEHNVVAESWYEARNLCLKKKGDLLDLPGQQDIKTLIEYAKKRGSDNPYVKYWIGLRKLTWIWSFKEEPDEVKFTNWLDQPQYENPFSGELCIYFDSNEDKWKTTDCNREMSVICQRREIIMRLNDITPNETTKLISTIYAAFGSVIAVVLICIGSVVITALIAKRKISAARSNTPIERQYCGVQTYSAPEVAHDYETIDLDDRRCNAVCKSLE